MNNRQVIPYGRQSIDEDDIAAVVAALRSDWLTTGPKVDEFETAVASFCDVRHGVAVANGTAALHSAMFALGIGPGDEVIVPPITFAASANCVLYTGATPVFADVTADGLLLDPATVETGISARTRAILAVDYAGQPADYKALRLLADQHGIALVADACHAIGASCEDRKVGSLADITCFSFHPVKAMTTGEGGMAMTDDDALAERMRRFRGHGITTDHAERAKQGAWHYEMVDLGWNYRITDIQCALGVSQLRKLQKWVQRRQAIAAKYDMAFREIGEIRSLSTRPGVSHAYHLYVVRVRERDRVFALMREAGINVNVHYVPVHLHPYYQAHLETRLGLCPVAESAYGEILSLPIFPGLSEDDQERVIETLIVAVDS